MVETLPDLQVNAGSTRWETTNPVPVDSGVPQGTVLGPTLFLCHINDLPECVRSQTRLFADDCLLYREIKTQEDHHTLQQTLKHLESWAKAWGMRFNAKKCYILSTRQKSNYSYSLDNTILQQVTSNPYLSITISEDLKWSRHINNISKKANSTLGFLHRNLRSCPKSCMRSAYVSLICPILEYGSVVWDPYYQTDISTLERIQHRAARFITGDYRSTDTGCVTSMLTSLELPTLQDRRSRRNTQLTYMYKTVKGLVPAIPPGSYLTPKKPGRSICAKNYTDFIIPTTLCMNRSVCNNTLSYVVPSHKTDTSTKTLSSLELY